MPHLVILLGVGLVALAAYVGSQLDLASLVGSAEKAEVRQAVGPAAPVQKLAALPEMPRLVTSDAQRAGPQSATGFDVLRIDPNGYSVIAGRATPNAEVVVSSSGKTVATARADASGDWSIVTPYKFEPGRHALSIAEKAAGATDLVQIAALDVDVAPATATAVVTSARGIETAGLQAGATAKAAAGPRVAAAGPGAAQQVERMIADAKAGDTRPEVRPVPITFVFREAALTDDGRSAVRLLTEYVTLKRPDSITLSGHADERGSDQHNMELSRERLDVVARQLRENGFTGRLVLVPKGKSEPYSGIDRRAMPREQVWQMDRRVELRVQ